MSTKEETLHLAIAIVVVLLFAAVFLLPMILFGPAINQATEESVRVTAEEELTEFKSPENDFRFTYPAGPNGYDLDQTDQLVDSTADSTYILTPKRRLNLAIDENSSLITIQLYKHEARNPLRWAEDNPEARFSERINEHQQGQIQGRVALWYQTGEPKPSDNLIIKAGDIIYFFRTHYRQPADSIRSDFLDILPTIRF
ncbi:MAG: hypothetical protein WDZ85_03475 [Candidatus Paceibacterota bacterium]